METAGSDSSAIDFNQALSVESGGKLLEIHPQHLKFLSLSGSHLNTTLRMIKHGTPCSVESVALDGKVNFHKMQQKDAAYAEASRAGLRWKVLPAAVLAQWPQLASLIQSAANRQAIAESTGIAIEREKLKPELVKSKPRCSIAMPAMFTFLRLFGGGQKLIDRASALDFRDRSKPWR